MGLQSIHMILSAVVQMTNADLNLLLSSPTWLRRLVMAAGTVVFNTWLSGSALMAGWTNVRKNTTIMTPTTQQKRVRSTTAEALSRSPTTTTMEPSDLITSRTPTKSYTAPRMPSNPHFGSGPPPRMASQACTVSPQETASASVSSPTLSTAASNADPQEIALRQ